MANLPDGRAKTKSSRIIIFTNFLICFCGRGLSVAFSNRQRLTALFFVLVFSTSIVLPGIVYAQSAKETKKTTPKVLDVPKQTEAPATGVIGQGSTLNGPNPTMDLKDKKPTKEVELTDKRTESTETYDLGNGQQKLRSFKDRVHYQKNGKWEKIDNKLIKDPNAADSSNPLGQAIAEVKSLTQNIDTYKLAANDWQARFAPSGDKVGTVRIESGKTKLAYVPQNAKKGVKPVISTQGDHQVVTYPDIWDGINLEYMVHGGDLKENIIIKDAKAANTYNIAITGAKLKQNKDGGFDIEGTEQKMAPLSVTLNNQGPTSEKVAKQTFKNGVLSVQIDKAWLTKQPASVFPIAVDPTWVRSGTISWNYTAYKSDGYVCPSTSCFMNIGGLENAGWKYWRTMFRVPFDQLRGKQLLNASFYLSKANRSFWLGVNEPRYVIFGHAGCLGFWCMDVNALQQAILIGQDSYTDITGQIQSRINANDWGAWFALYGEEIPGYTTYKGLDAVRLPI